jgi:nicotinamidase-related amidase
VDAIQLGLRPIVVLEAVGDRSPAAHEQSIVDMQAKYADVVRLDDAVEYLARAFRGAARRVAPVRPG